MPATAPECVRYARCSLFVFGLHSDSGDYRHFEFIIVHRPRFARGAALYSQIIDKWVKQRPGFEPRGNSRALIQMRVALVRELDLSDGGAPAHGSIVLVRKSAFLACPLRQRGP
jgi:hypothetical protein